MKDNLKNKQFRFKMINEFEESQKKSFRWNIILAIFMVALILGLLYFGLRNFNQKEVQISEYANQAVELKKQNSKNLQIIEEVSNTIQDIQSSDSKLSENVKQKLESIENKINSIEPIHFISGYRVIRYYKRKADSENMITVMDSLGFDINLKSSLTDTLNGEPVNYIIYGDSVFTDEVRLLVNTLYDRDISFKELRLIKNNPDFNWKRYAIEVGYEAALLGKPYLTKEEAFKQIEQNPSLIDSDTIIYKPQFSFEGKK